MILLTLSRGKGEETVRLQLPASPAEIGETFAFLDRISLDTTATAILDVSSNVPVLYRCLYDVDVEDSEQFQKLQKLAERTEALSPAKAAIFSGALDAECVWNLEGALTVADRLDEYMLVNNVSSDSELGIYLVNKGITPFPDRFKPYINYARVGAEYREKHGGEYSSGNYVQKKTPELLENERLDGVFRISSRTGRMRSPCNSKAYWPRTIARVSVPRQRKKRWPAHGWSWPSPVPRCRSSTRPTRSNGGRKRKRPRGKLSQ